MQEIVNLIYNIHTKIFIVAIFVQKRNYICTVPVQPYIMLPRVNHLHVKCVGIPGKAWDKISMFIRHQAYILHFEKNIQVD